MIQSNDIVSQRLLKELKGSKSEIDKTEISKLSSVDVSQSEFFTVNGMVEEIKLDK